MLFTAVLRILAMKTGIKRMQSKDGARIGHRLLIAYFPATTKPLKPAFFSLSSIAFAFALTL